jgi:Zn finger protein HypA/HybF involved in hydrogenase expression
MFIPPDPSNYPEESALNRQMMHEDREDFLDRFREAPTIVVWCKTCKDYEREGLVQIESREKDANGHEVLTFICPTCKTKQEGLRVAR